MEKDTQIKPTKFSDVTPEIIHDWKARYGERNIRQIDIVIDTKEVASEIEGDDPLIENVYASFVVKRPSRTVVDAMARHSLTNNVSDANKVLLSNCVLGGDMDELENDGGLYSTLIQKLGEMAHRKEVHIKKL